ncbi:FAD-dependent oxidoreductase [Catenulispora sp. NF23]|uniref:flavin monoamine oxidase family protein n=1 Tax=Catenulispora pinistramenti TaxID=2705254 RepID=UPI001BAA8579|nr:NAD(P)/FAD-dependent oxidoreductase [Catenulispora pinistramenti]MBS2532189.1 FAD-dependent oxidoreductase [Catenulispora pinistramenti]
MRTGSGIPSALRQAFAAEGESRRTGIPVDELTGMRAEHVHRAQARAQVQDRDQAQVRAAASGRAERYWASRAVSRRTVLAGAAGAAAATALIRAPRANAATSPRVVIVGAGLAGLRCAHSLWTQGGVASTVYEADTSHLGGRCWSLRGFFAGGQVSEHGGSFISSTDTAVLNLATALGLSTEYANGGALDSGNYAAWINSASYPSKRQQQDWVADAYSAFSASYQAMGTPRYNSYTAQAARLDQMSCLDYLASIGLSSGAPLTQLIETLQLQSGGEPGSASAIGLIGFLGSSKTFDSSAGFDEKYHLAGGNDQLVTGMLGQLPAGTVQQGHQLIAICQNSDGSYTLTFDAAGTTVTTVADHVVLALPFRTLRNVDYSRAGLSALKNTAIQQQGMGQNAKLVLQLTAKTWPAAGGNGVSNTGPTGYQSAWDGSVNLGAKGAPALLVNFPGGNVAQNTLTGAAHGPAPAADVTWFLNQIENLYPGTKAAYNGRAYEDHWSRDPWHLGAYHYYEVGQYTTIAGYEAVQEGRVHFAGEHTDVDNMTLDSAVRSGERAAAEIRAQV